MNIADSAAGLGKARTPLLYKPHSIASIVGLIANLSESQNMVGARATQIGGEGEWCLDAVAQLAEQ